MIRAGGGSPRDTLSVLDQLLAGAEGNHVAYQRALALLGATDVALIDDAVEALAAGDAAALFGAVESVIDAGHDPRRFATDLLERFRDLIVLQAVPDAGDRGVVEAPEDVLEQMHDQAARIGTATLTRYAEVVHAGLGEMRGATAPRLLLEVVCARLLLPSASDTESALLQRVERIETRLDMSIPAAERADSGPSTGASQRQFSRRSQAPEPEEPRRFSPRRRSRLPPSPPPRAAQAPDPVAAPSAPESTPEPASAEATPVASAPGAPDASAVRTMWPTVREKVRAAQPPHRCDARRRDRPRRRGQHAGARASRGPTGQAPQRKPQRRDHPRGSQGRARRRLERALRCRHSGGAGHPCARRPSGVTPSARRRTTKRRA